MKNLETDNATINLSGMKKITKEPSVIRHYYPKSDRGEIPKLIQYHNLSFHPFLLIFKQISDINYKHHFPTYDGITETENSFRKRQFFDMKREL